MQTIVCSFTIFESVLSSERSHIREMAAQRKGYTLAIADTKAVTVNSLLILWSI